MTVIRFKNGHTYPVLTGSTLNIGVEFDIKSLKELDEIALDISNTDNLEHVEILEESSNFVYAKGEFMSLQDDNTLFLIQKTPNGYKAITYFKEMSDTEKQIIKLRQALAMHDDAIADLGDVIVASTSEPTEEQTEVVDQTEESVDDSNTETE